MTIRSFHWAQGHRSRDIAGKLAEFINGTKKSLDIAIYDFRLSGIEKAIVVEAIKTVAKNHSVRIAYDHTKQPERAGTGKGGVANDPAPHGTMAFIREAFSEGTRVQARPIAGSHLMHSKYIIRDGTDVWMGSANFTNNAWRHQENNVIEIGCRALAGHYEANFEELWKAKNIQGTGKNDYGQVEVEGASVEFGFAPGSGSAIASLFVDAIQGTRAKSEVRLATMVLSSGPILGALVDHLRAGGNVLGVYDATQMGDLEQEWHKHPDTSFAKLAMWKTVKPHLVGKHSTPFGDGSVCDFMHNKVLVTDRTVVTGSFNLSRNAEANAENALAIHDPALAEVYGEYVMGLVKRYTVPAFTS